MSETAIPSVSARAGKVAGVYEEPSPRDIARDVITRLGVAEVAAWCGVRPNTVFQWLKRGTDQQPIPLLAATVLFSQAAKSGVHFDIRAIAPALRDVL